MGAWVGEDRAGPGQGWAKQLGLGERDIQEAEQMGYGAEVAWGREGSRLGRGQ